MHDVSNRIKHGRECVEDCECLVISRNGWIREGALVVLVWRWYLCSACHVQDGLLAGRRCVCVCVCAWYSGANSLTHSLAAWLLVSKLFNTRGWLTLTLPHLTLQPCRCVCTPPTWWLSHCQVLPASHSCVDIGLLFCISAPVVCI